MKKLLIYLLPSLFLASCKKEVYESYSPVKEFLRSELSAADFSQLNFYPVVVTSYANGYSTYKVQFNNSDEFVAVQCMNGLPVKAKIILLERTDSAMTFNGRIQISSPDRREIISSRIEHGTIRAFHANPAVIVPTILPGVPQYQELEEVVIVASYGGSGIEWSTWINLMAFLENGGGGGWANYYEYYDGSYYNGGSGGGGGATGGGGGSSSGSGSGGGTVAYEEPMVVDVENQYANDPIDVVKYLNCFATIPDAGSVCSIKIFSDIPVNGDPTKFFDFQSASPGHAFIQLVKSNNGQLVVQEIGFYPKTKWKVTLTTSPVESKFVDNGSHEFNAAYEVNISPGMLTVAIDKIKSIASMDYDIDDNNCADFAVNVFNSAVSQSQQLNVPLYLIPGGLAPNGSRTPQGIFDLLQNIKSGGGPEAGKIEIAQLAGWAPNSNGPCN